jgi:Dyp-type peroxidase family
MDDKSKPHEERDPNFELWAIGISSDGYRKMGFSDERFPPDFRDGFAKRSLQAALSDSKQWTDALWEGGKRYDALIIFATRKAEHEAALGAAREKVESAFGEHADVTPKMGFVRRKNANRADDSRNPKQDRRPTEHFGFVDGVSQPVMINYLRPRAHAPVGPRKAKWDDKSGFGLVLVKEIFPKDPKGPPEFGSYGAFLTIKQDVDKFDTLAGALAQKVGCSFDEAQELIIGRKKTGDAPVPGGSDRNDFDSSFKGADRSWPYASHIRKMNGRINTENNRRIVRRGVLYKDRDEVGLLFQSFQKSLAEQFEFLLRSWANFPPHAVPNTGVDPVAGALTTEGQTWPLQNGDGTCRHCVSGVTTIKGGEYFYFPSILSLLAFSKLQRT